VWLLAAKVFHLFQYANQLNLNKWRKPPGELTLSEVIPATSCPTDRVLRSKEENSAPFVNSRHLTDTPVTNRFFRHTVATVTGAGSIHGLTSRSLDIRSNPVNEIRLSLIHFQGNSK